MTKPSHSAYLKVVSPGTLSLLQDAGRFGMTGLGLTQGGPLDGHSFAWANALVGNPLHSTVIEHSIGGLIVQASAGCTVAVTGAVLPLLLNGKAVACWQALTLKAGDELELGYMTQGLRAYLAVSGGFDVPLQFGSSATVMREGVGGLHQDGSKLAAGDQVPLAGQATLPALTTPDPQVQQFSLPPLASVATLTRAEQQQPGTSSALSLRLLEGYQHQLFSAVERARFYLNPYQVSTHCDRMGYKLSGSAISCNSRALLSEGISLGAVQIPPDGQPIVLLNDRQTLGGYPKIGTVLSLDCWRLAQTAPGSLVQFSPLDSYQVHNALALYRASLSPLARAAHQQHAATQEPI